MLAKLAKSICDLKDLPLWLEEAINFDVLNLAIQTKSSFLSQKIKNKK